MVEETFIAPNPREAFELAREKYGQFSRLALLKAVQTKNQEGHLVSQITVSVEESYFLDSIGVNEEQELINEIEELKTQMSQMTSLVDDESNIESAQMKEIKALMLKKGLSSEWLDKFMDSIAGTDVADDEQLVLSYLLEELDEQISIKKENFTNPKMMMLIGSTGVGKTTTIAKLAARYTLLLDNPLKVALVNLDSFRVGAYEQLTHYADKMQLAHVRVEKVEMFAEVLDELSGYDIVLIDTAGISPYDTGRLIKTIEFLKSTRNHKIETSLVISATAKREDIMDIYEHFSFLEIDNAIITKFDETKRVGELFSFLVDKKVPISYISTGQGVPEDLHPATKELLMDRFVGELHV